MCLTKYGEASDIFSASFFLFISSQISLTHVLDLLILSYRHLCWEGLGAGGEGNDRGWDGWMASLTRWMWVSVNSGSWWWTGRPGVLRFMGLQRVGHNWATDLIGSDRHLCLCSFFFSLFCLCVLQIEQFLLICSQFTDSFCCCL